VKRLCAVVLVVLAACGSEHPPPPIEVLASIEVEDSLAGQLDAFTRDTGIPVDVDWGNSAEHADRLIGKSGEPVDVIVTDNAADIWRAADRGALRPIESTALAAQPPYLRDPDDYWGALSARFHAIYHRNGVTPVIASLRDLGGAGYAGRICVSSSRLSSNRSLIAYLIEAEGVREAERLVRRWIRNLARPPFESEQELLEALREGACDYGIASWDGSGNATGATAFLSEPPTLDITAIGVNRHAGQPEVAQRLVDWLLREAATRMQWADDYSPPPLHVAGWRDAEARLLAESAGYR
jgi:iron(III) transport system substrate-binding protein